jgi:hypothetical protein
MDDSRLHHQGLSQVSGPIRSGRIADRLERVDLQQAFTDAEREMIESAQLFFLATIDPDGLPDVSYRSNSQRFPMSGCPPGWRRPPTAA